MEFAKQLHSTACHAFRRFVKRSMARKSEIRVQASSPGGKSSCNPETGGISS